MLSCSLSWDASSLYKASNVYVTQLEVQPSDETAGSIIIAFLKVYKLK